MAYFVPYNFAIMADSGVTEGGTLDAPEAVVKFKVAWADRINFVNFICGTTIGGPGGIIRLIPAQYPPSPNMYATREFQIEPLGKLQTEGLWVTYPYAIVTIKFAVPTYSFDNDDPSGQPWTTLTLDTGGEFLTLPESAYKFAGGVPVNGSVGKVIPQVGVNFKRHWVPYLPVAEMLSIVGKVNSGPIQIANFYAAPETLLFLGGPSQRQNDTAGGVSQEVEYKFQYRPISWNMFIHPDGNTGWAYIFDNNGNKVYDSADFSVLP